MSEIHVIGIGAGGLSAKQRDILATCPTIVTSSRFRPLVDGLGAVILPIAPVKEMFRGIAEQAKLSNIGVLASGDPLFFGIGRTLVDKFGRDRVRIYPAFSAMQLLCAHFNESWDDAKFVSLHGRDTGHIVPLLLQAGKSVVLTDRTNSPARLAGLIVDYCHEIEDMDLLAKCSVMVGENLGSRQERCVQGTLAEIAGQEFADLNLMLVKRPVTASMGTSSFGLREDEIVHSRGLITKNEVRAATLHHLRLAPHDILWDVGAGSGSVSLEASCLCPTGYVFAVERNEEQLANIKANIRRYQAYNVRVIQGEAPDVFDCLPAPNRVFIGGSGSRLPEIIEAAARQLVVGGRMVVNAVIEKTRIEAPCIMRDLGLRVWSSEINVKRYGADGRVEVFNPITTFVGEV